MFGERRKWGGHRGRNQHRVVGAVAVVGDMPMNHYDITKGGLGLLQNYIAASSLSLQLCGKKLRKQQLGRSPWKEKSKVKNTICGEGGKIAQIGAKKQNKTGLCVVYIIQLATSLSSLQEAGGMSRSVASLQRRPHNVHSHSSTDSPLFFFSPPFPVHRWHRETLSQRALIFRRWEAAEIYVLG